MTTKQKTEFEKLLNMQERAKFLLGFPIETRIDISGLSLVYKAYVLGVQLPGDFKTKEAAVKKSTAWLKRKTKP